MTVSYLSRHNTSEFELMNFPENINRVKERILQILNTPGNKTSKLQVGTLTRRQSAGINNISGFLFNLVHDLSERRASQGHQTGSSRFQNTKGSDKLEERVNTTWLGGSIGKNVISFLRRNHESK